MLAQARYSHLHKSILDSTCGIIFFALLYHQGLRLEELEELVNAPADGRRIGLIMQLKESFEFLTTQLEDLRELLKQKVVIFFEALKVVLNSFLSIGCLFH